MQLWNSLTPDQQAALIGGLVAALVYLGRYVYPPWFENADSVAKFQRTAAVVVICGATVLTSTLAAGWQGFAPFLAAWALAYMTAEAGHTLAARTMALR